MIRANIHSMILVDIDLVLISCTDSGYLLISVSNTKSAVDRMSVKTVETHPWGP